MIPEELIQNLATEWSVTVFNPTVNAILTATSTNFAAVGSTEPTYFRPFNDSPNRLVAVSVQEVNGAGVTVSPAGGFVLDLYRTLDGGFSYQFVKSYTTAQEVVEQYMAFANVYYRFQLRTKGANNIRIRALAVN